MLILRYSGRPEAGSPHEVLLRRSRWTGALGEEMYA